jgi:dTDP-4-dehydrorhamnose 3,5-epimerase
VTERFVIHETPLSALKIIERKVIEDSLGYLERVFCADELGPLIGGRQIEQITHTMTSARGTVRGLHFQHPPHAELKFVSCLRGEVFDVAVDVRRGSPTFLHWHGEVLSDGNHRSMVIPEGFAHGFQSLDDACELIYFHTAPHAPLAEGGLNPMDERLGISWPEPVVGLSPRDAGQPPAADNFRGVEL